LKIDTNLKDVSGLIIWLRGKAGRINQILLESQRLNKDPDQVVRESRLNLIALDEEEKEFGLVRQFSEGQQTFSVYKADRKIGALEFNKDGGLIVRWEEMSLREGLEAVVSMVNLLEETPWGGERRLKGLVLKAVAEGGGAEPVEAKPEPVATPTEPIEEVEAVVPAPAPAAVEKAKEGLGF
jgi:hypothetical protein